ncbi:MAG: leucine-rich repeat domain-containing protein [Clostridia bacterium]|nr:leucine-rich repeat domain-containing protein [Clostridia bacterium]
MKTRKLLLTALSMMFVATSAFAFASCDKIGALKGDKGDKGEQGAQGTAGQDGADGSTITGVEYDENGDLVFTFSDGSTQTVVDPNKHTHKYGAWSKFMGETCEDGIFSRTCECGDVEWKQGVPHLWGTPNVDEATCSVKGTSTKVCLRCGDTDVELLYKEHTLSAEDETLCTVCGHTVVGTEGLKYELLDNGTYAVSKYVGKDTAVVIPGVYDNTLVTEIKTNAFIGTSATDPAPLKTVVIPNTITKIEQAAFAYTSLKTVTIPDSVTKLGKNAFKGCPNLKTLTVGSGLTSIDPAVDQTVFNGCTALETVNYNSPVIGYRMFYNCSALTTVNLGAAMTGIQQEAFRGCSALNDNTIDLEKVTLLERGVFQGTAVKNVVLPATYTTIPRATFAASTIESIVMGNVTEIGKQAFYDCKSFKTIYYTCAESEYVAPTTIGSNNEPFTAATAYYYSETEAAGCWRYVDGVPTLWATAPVEPETPAEPVMSFEYELNAAGDGYIVKKYTGNVAEVVIPATYEGKPVVEIYSAGKGKEAAFQGNTTITSVTIPGSVKTMGDYAFTGCTALTSVTFEEGFTAIDGIYAFSGCSSLATVNLPSTLKSISRNAFASNTSLKTLVIPEGVETIGYRAFYKVTLETLVVPKSMTTIGAQLFNNGSVATIKYAGTQAEWEAMILNVVDGSGNVTTEGDAMNTTSFSTATISYNYQA